MTHTTERVRVHETRRPVPGPPQSPRRYPWLGWVVIAAGLFAAAVLILQAITSDTAPQPNDTEQAPSAPSRVGVPGSADGAERYLADYGNPRPMGVPGSADGAERYLAELRPR